MTAPKLHRSLIQNMEMFRALSDDELDRTLEHAQPRRLLPGDAVYRQGELAGYFFILLHGTLKVVQATAEGEQVVVRFVSPGDVFGIARMMRRPDYPATVLAVQESLVLAWPSSEWERMVAANPQLTGNALQTVGQRLQSAHSRIRELSTEEVEQRVARAILRLLDQSGRASEEGRIEIDFPITRQDIAEMTGTTLHTVSRILSLWKERGIVENARKRVIVLQPDELIRYAEGAQGSRHPEPA